MTATESLRQQLDASIADHDRPGAIRLALEAVESRSTSVDDLYLILSAILVELGSSWKSGSTEVWQEHFASSVVRTIVEACAPHVEEEAGPDRTATVVVAAPSDEYHDLGLRMLSDRFALRGWNPQFLGANVPSEELVNAVAALGADAVALGASTHFHRLQLAEYVQDLREAHPSVRVWVGGPAFAHDHDGWDEEQVLDPLAIPSPADL